jgi:hypothetical protein
VSTFLAEIKTLRSLDVVKLQMTISLDAHAKYEIASAMSLDSQRGWVSPAGFWFYEKHFKKRPEEISGGVARLICPGVTSKVRETIDAQAREFRGALQRETATVEILLHDHSDYDYREYSAAL